ncbi:hypothetical protein Tco_0822213 [Tanacetum coccineum]|uniref:Uncharacterized protein n=1 Tax=Tanacetum coccineum TaxID=301880 RepID=A0ABQ5AJA5_9ASTR
MKEGDGDITTWEEFVMKIFKISRMHLIFMCLDSMIKSACDTKTAQRRDDEEGHDPFEFIPSRNSKFKDHKKVDDTTKRALLHTWIEIGNEEGLLNDKVSSDEEWEEHECGNPPNDSSPKPYLNINNEKDKNHHNETNGDIDKLSGMDLSNAPHSEKINNEHPNEEEPYDVSQGLDYGVFDALLRIWRIRYVKRQVLNLCCGMPKALEF